MAPGITDDDIWLRTGRERFLKPRFSRDIRSYARHCDTAGVTDFIGRCFKHLCAARHDGECHAFASQCHGTTFAKSFNFIADERALSLYAEIQLFPLVVLH